MPTLPTINASVSSTTNNPYTGVSNGFTYYNYTSSGTFQITGQPITIYYVVVGGGGNGSIGSPSEPAGGGGSGGQILTGNILLSSGTYTITVGGGGSSSTFLTNTALPGSNGAITAGGTNPWGYGDGGNGANIAASTNGSSGINVDFYDGSSGTYFGGGGGGGGTQNITIFPPGSGGIFGGGGGGAITSPTGNGAPGQSNTGGGGGGGSAINQGNGGAGGSGVVLLYFVSIPPSPPVTLYVDGNSFLNGNVYIQQSNYNQLTMTPTQLGYSLISTVTSTITTSLDNLIAVTIPCAGVWLVEGQVSPPSPYGTTTYYKISLSTQSQVPDYTRIITNYLSTNTEWYGRITSVFVLQSSTIIYLVGITTNAGLPNTTTLTYTKIG
jgi:hypothetical protein